MKKPLPPSSCAPRYHIGTVVTYTDHRGKSVHGMIREANCKWFGYNDGEQYCLTYGITHPSYSRLQHIAEGEIRGEVTQ